MIARHPGTDRRRRFRFAIATLHPRRINTVPPIAKKLNSHFLLKACESCFFEKPRITCVFDRTTTNHRFSKEYRPSRTTQCKPRRGGRVIASRGWSVAEPTAGVVFWSAVVSRNWTHAISSPTVAVGSVSLSLHYTHG